MLTMIWIGIALVVSNWCCYKAFDAERADEEPFSWYIGSYCVLTMALAITADSTVIAIYKWLVLVLPETGTQLNQATGLVLTGLLCMVFVGGLTLAQLMAFSRGVPSLKSGAGEKRSGKVIPWPTKRKP